VSAALSQAAGLGVALAFFAQIQLGFDVSPVVGALGASVLTTFVLSRRARVRVARETLVGIVFIAASAFAVLAGDRIAQEAHDVAAILFGTAVLVRPIDLVLVGGGTAVALGGVLAFGRALAFAGFDPDGARVQGVKVGVLEAAFWTVFALEVSVATRALGSLPVFAFAVLPATCGLLLARRLGIVIVISVGVGALCGAAGYVAAFFLSLPVGASQAALSVLFALAAFIAARLRTYTGDRSH
jgi:zinc transport system permease protein